MVVHKVGIGIQGLLDFKVYLGNGEYLNCKEVCHQVPTLSIQGTLLTEDLFVLPMEGVNIVLETLGEVKIHNKKLTMSF